MKKSAFIFSFLLFVLFSTHSFSQITGPETINFDTTDDTNLGPIANDGEGGSTNITGVTINIFAINASGTATNADLIYNANAFAPGLETGLSVGTDPATAAWRGVSIKSDDGSEFDFNGFDSWEFSFSGAVTLNVRGYKNGVATGSGSTVITTADGDRKEHTSSDFPDVDFGNVDEVRIIAATDFYGTMNVFFFGAAVSATVAPTVTTTAASTIATTSATLAGNVTANGGASVTERGIVYAVTATNANPLISGTGVTKDTNGTGTGVFSESITGLTAGTQYSFKAYAINSVGTSYGAVTTFTTSVAIVAPTVSTTAASTIATTSATLAGNATANGGASITERGIVYAVTATNANPIISGTGVTKDTNGTGTGVFSESITDLTAGTQYSFKAYAINSAGTSYGAVTTFTTSALVSPTITFANINKTYGDTDFNLGATSNSSGTISYSIIAGGTGTASLSGTNNKTVALGNAGTVTIRASQIAGGAYGAGTKDITLTISAKAITITADVKSKTYGDSDPTLTHQITSGSLETGDAFTGSLVRAGGEDVGAYVISVGTVSAGSNYNTTFVSDNLSITTKAITVTADSGQNKTYGAADPANYTYAITSGNLAFADTFSGSLTRAVGENAGNYAITQGTLTLGANYNITYVSDNFTINKAVLTATADNKTRDFGVANPALTISYSGFKNSETSAVIDVEPSISTSAVIASPAGTYPITLSGGSDNNYNLTLVDGTLSVNLTDQTITFGALSDRTYGSSSFDLAATSSSGLSVNYTSLNTSVATVSGNTVTIVGAGTATIRASQPGNGSYAAASPVDQTLTINKKTLTVTADNKSRAYGDANPTFTISYTGFVNSEDASSLTTLPIAVTSATVLSDVGSYPIIPSGGVSTNYAFSFVNGTLTIGKATLTATADNKTRDQGVANPTLTISYSGFVNGDDETDIDTPPGISTTAVLGSPVGTYPITLSGGSDNNYNLTLVNGTLSVNLTSQTITFDALSDKTYGGSSFDLAATSSSGLSVSYTSLNTSVATVSGNTVTIVGAGTATIRASQSGNGSYAAASLVDQVLTVNKVSLTATADNKSRVYGDANPVFTLSYSGFLNSEDASSLTTLPIAVTLATVLSDVGSYPIIPSGGVADNYTFSYVNGTLSIGKAPLTVTADNIAIEQGETIPTLTLSYNGLKNSETSTVIDSEPDIATTAVLDSPIGTYPITLTGGSDNNYNLTLVDGTLSIGLKAQTITFGALSSKTIGDAPFSLTGTASSGLTVSYTSSNTAVATVSGSTVTIIAAGSTNITASQTGDANYGAASNVIQTLVVKDNQTTTFEALASKTFGDTPFSLTGTASSGLAVSYESSNTAVATVSGSTVTIVGAGSTNITASQAGNTNYTAAPNVIQPLTVEKASQTITFGALSNKTYGSSTFRLSGTATSGLAVSYVSSNTSVATVFGNTVTIIGVGTTTITASQAGNTNYTAASSVDQVLTIDKKALTVTADNKSRVYGDANPTFTLSYSGFVNSEDTSVLTTVPITVTSATVLSDVGETYTIIPSGGVADNYTFSYGNGTLSIKKAPLTVTADDKTKEQGLANPTLTFSYSGFKNSETATVIDTEPAIATTAVLSSPVGAYPITLTGGSDDNYNLTLVDGTLSVTLMIQTITFADINKTYGDANFDLGATSNSAGAISYSIVAGGTGTASLSGTNNKTVTPGNAGTVTFRATQVADGIYGAGTKDITLTISTKAITVTADAKSKTYGDSDPALTYQLTAGSLESGDSFSGALERASGEDVGTHAIGVGTVSAGSNYNTTFVSGDLTIDKATLIATADNKTRHQGVANSDLTITYSGFKNSETATVIDTEPAITTTAVVASPVGTYPITLTGGSDNNYDFTLINGTLTITAVTVPTVTTTVIGSGTTIGDTYAPLGGNVTADGGASVIERGVVYSITAINADPLISGTGVIKDANGTGTGDFFELINDFISGTQYSFKAYATNSIGTSYGAVQTFTTIPNPTITFVDIDKTYGDAEFDLSATSNSSGAITYSSSDTSIASLSGNTVIIRRSGTVTITASQVADGAYSSGTKGISLTISKAVLTVTGNNKSKLYGSANPFLTGTITGFVNSESFGVISTFPVLSTTATTGSPVGEYPITSSGGTAPNYTFIDGAGTLTITKRSLTVSADNKTRGGLGEPKLILTITYNGFVNGDSASDLDVLPIISSTVNMNIRDKYPIILTGGSDHNYELILVNGIFSIGFAPQIICGMSPNGDGKNDAWNANCGFGYGAKGVASQRNIIAVQVFNRSGKLVFKNQDYQNDWEGVSNQPGFSTTNKVPAGTYLTIVDLGDGGGPVKGWLYIKY